MEPDFKGGSSAWIYTFTQVPYWFATLPVPTPFLFLLLFVKHTGHSYSFRKKSSKIIDVSELLEKWKYVAKDFQIYLLYFQLKIAWLSTRAS